LFNLLSRNDSVGERIAPTLNRTFANRLATILPLLGGEGRGEGELLFSRIFTA